MSALQRPLHGQNGIHIVETFVMANDVVTDNNLGHNGFQFTTIGNATTYSYLTGVTDTNGVLRSTTNTTADGDGSVVHSFPDGIVLEGEEGGFSAVVRYPNIAGNALAGNDIIVGVGDVVTAAESTNSIGVWLDAGVVKLRTDSAANGDELKAAADWDRGTQSGTDAGLTSGTTAVLGEWLAIEARWHGENANGGPDKVDFFLGSDTNPVVAQQGKVYVATVDCHLANTETVELHVLKHYQNSGSGDTLEADIFNFEFWQFWRQ